MECTTNTEVYVDKEQKIKPLFHCTYRRISFLKALKSMQFLQDFFSLVTSMQSISNIQLGFVTRNCSVHAASVKLLSSNVTHANRHWQIYFSVMYVHVLSFYNIYSLTHFHIKIFVRAQKAEDVFHDFPQAQCFQGQCQFATGFPDFSLILCL